MNSAKDYIRSIKIDTKKTFITSLYSPALLYHFIIGRNTPRGMLESFCTESFTICYSSFSSKLMPLLVSGCSVCGKEDPNKIYILRAIIGIEAEGSYVHEGACDMVRMLRKAL